MKQLENLQSTANEMLSGLVADNKLKYRIIAEARSTRPARPARFAVALACAAALALAVTGNAIFHWLPVKNENPLIKTVAAGAPDLGNGTQSALLDVPRGSITFSDQAGTPSYRGIWAAGAGGNFPLLRAEGRFYRLLTNPTAIDNSLLGDTLGTVGAYTSEPALASSDGIISNIVPAGETVYAVRGMRGAMAAATVNGEIRVFQRVSFANSARVGGELLADTLRADSVTGLELSGVGTIDNTSTASALMDTLLGSAVFARSSSNETGQSLLIRLASGLVLQMSVKNDSVMACGTWDCPAFFDAFRAAVK
jgi:hypothetical protein